VRLLHTSDWHVGKVLKGHARIEEQVAVLAQVVAVAEAEQPDLVIVAGDLFDTAAPTPDATRVVTRALSALRRTGAEVVAIAGNHDNGASLDALRAWADAAGITLRGTVRDRAGEHVVTGTSRDGEPWQLVALPFLSQRYAVRATEMFSLTAAEANQTYADHMARLLAELCAGFGPETINLVTAHVTVVGGTMGGGEREAHTIQSYAVPASVFPAHTQYVALGHLHRAQVIPAGCPVRYCGAPLAVDFGEELNIPSVSVVDVAPGTAAKVREAPITAGKALLTVHGTLEQLRKLTPGDAWLRVYVREKPRAGLREEVQDLLPNALEVRIDPEFLAPPGEDGVPKQTRSGRAPGELFADYLAAKGHADPAVAALFDRLHGEVTA
jgi:DNA repair protein SbcD/Mre11